MSLLSALFLGCSTLAGSDGFAPAVVAPEVNASAEVPTGGRDNPDPVGWATLDALAARIDREGAVERRAEVGFPPSLPRLPGHDYLHAIEAVVDLDTFTLTPTEVPVATETRVSWPRSATVFRVEEPRVLREAGAVLALAWTIQDETTYAGAGANDMFATSTWTYLVEYEGRHARRFRVHYEDRDNRHDLAGTLRWEGSTIASVEYVQYDEYSGPSHPDVWKRWVRGTQ